MGSFPYEEKKPHAVCIPFPAQGHVSPMLTLAKLLHSSGFHVTFVNSDFNHNRLLKSRGGGAGALSGLPSFRFESVPDGLPPTDADATQDIPSLCHSLPRHTLAPFRDLLRRLNSDPAVPPVSCVVSDGCMSFTLDAAEELGIPEVLFWTTSACGFLGYLNYKPLVDNGFTPLKDESYMTNGYLETAIDWIPGMRNIRLKDLPTFIRTTDSDDVMLNYLLAETERVQRGKAIILNTFDDLEAGVLGPIRSALRPPVYTLGALHRLARHVTPSSGSEAITSSLWKEDVSCLDWLDTKPPGSVVYVNFGSITVMTAEQLKEFAWGLAGSGKDFLWVVRPDLVGGESAVVPEEFVEETRGRGRVASWCPQERVLGHVAVGGFLTHSGWNSTLESLCAGVPMLCWPFFAEQQTNCRFACGEWGVGMEIDGGARREEIGRLVRELMEGQKGKEMRTRALHWKSLAEVSVSPAPAGGRNDDVSSFSSFHSLVDQLKTYSSFKDSD